MRPPATRRPDRSEPCYLTGGSHMPLAADGCRRSDAASRHGGLPARPALRASAARCKRGDRLAVRDRQADEGRRAPGEFQLWRERAANSTQRIAFPQSFHDLYYNSGHASARHRHRCGLDQARSTAAIDGPGARSAFRPEPRLLGWSPGIAGIDPGRRVDRLRRLGEVTSSTATSRTRSMRARSRQTGSSGYFPRDTQGAPTIAPPSRKIRRAKLFADQSRRWCPGPIRLTKRHRNSPTIRGDPYRVAHALHRLFPMRRIRRSCWRVSSSRR